MAADSLLVAKPSCVALVTYPCSGCEKEVEGASARIQNIPHYVTVAYCVMLDDYLRIHGTYCRTD